MNEENEKMVKNFKEEWSLAISMCMREIKEINNYYADVQTQAITGFFIEVIENLEKKVFKTSEKKEV